MQKLLPKNAPRGRAAAQAAPAAAQAEPTLPESVRIGPFIHSIEWMDPVNAAECNCIGQYDTVALKIDIVKDMPAQRHVETLMHEIFHGLWHTTGLRGHLPEDEEHCVTVLSTAMISLMRDNPGLIAWFYDRMQDSQ